MFKIIGSIPNKMSNNNVVEMMINYINDVIRINKMEVTILQRKEGIIVVPTKFYNKNKTYKKNVFTYWQKTRKGAIELSILPELNPKENRERCQFRTITDLEERNIAKMIYDRYNALIEENNEIFRT